jgi:hypothetical protein
MLRNRVVSHKVVEALVPIVGYTVGITIYSAEQTVSYQRDLTVLTRQ